MELAKTRRWGACAVPLACSLVLVMTASCSRTHPESVWPPVVGPIPVTPFPEDDGFGDDDFGDFEDTESGGEETPEATGGPGFDSALPTTAPTDLERKAECTGKTCALSEWVPEAAFAKSTTGDDSPGAIWLHSVKGGSTLVVPRHSELTLQGVVLSGSALAKGDDGGAAQKLGVWGAFRAPGGGCTVTADGGDARVLLALTTSKATLKESLDAGKAQGWKFRWKKRNGAFQTAKGDEVSPHSWADGGAHARVLFGGVGAKSGSLSIVMGRKDLAIPVHSHDKSWEHTAVLQGAGTYVGGGKTHEVSNGKIFSVPMGTKHEFKPSGATPTLAVQVWSPGGPEARFEKLATEAASGKAK